MSGTPSLGSNAKRVCSSSKSASIKPVSVTNVKTVRRLQRLLISSTSAKYLATRKVTQDNRGKRTAGVDGVKNITPNQRLTLAATLKVERKARPIRRVWIPKPRSDEKRPLGIPVLRERAIQALVKLALEPEWEAKFEPNSYGFRPGRSAQDAVRAIYDNIRSKTKYVLDADIAKCFDRIDHAALLQKLNTFPALRRQIKAWLKAGVMDGGRLFQTDEGTPQGGVISPLLANIALHGMETKLVDSFPKWTRVKSITGRSYSTPFSPAVIRYADDFVVMHSDLEVILKSKEIVLEWLAGLGLELKDTKTQITHSLTSYEGKVGIDFLGFNLRQYSAGKSKSFKTTGRLSEGTKEHGRSLGFMSRTKPSKEAKKRHYRSLCDVIDTHRASTQKVLIQNLNPIIRGWSNYYFTSTDGFSDLDHLLFRRLFQWARRRHPMKNEHWIANKYWHVDKTGTWAFSDKGLELFKHCDVKFRHHVRVRTAKSPYDGDWVYWSTRLGHYPDIKPSVARLLRQQKGRCAWCRLRFKHEDQMETDHRIPKSVGGLSGYGNLQLLHGHCHDEKHRAIDAGPYDQSQVIEEPCDVKASSTVLQTNRCGDAAV
jgi:RNA-directed DNA polymerase